MNKNEMKNYLKDLQEQISYIAFFGNSNAYNVSKRYYELLEAKGYTHYYIRSNAKKDEIADYLECYINSIYDCGFSDKIKF